MTTNLIKIGWYGKLAGIWHISNVLDMTEHWMSNIPNSVQNLEYFAQEITFKTEKNIGNVVLRVSLSWGHYHQRNLSEYECECECDWCHATFQSIASKFEKCLEIEIYRTLRSHIGWHWKKMRCQLKIQSSQLKNWSFVVCIIMCTTWIPEWFRADHEEPNF